jgi:hypothetical protein
MTNEQSEESGLMNRLNLQHEPHLRISSININPFGLKVLSVIDSI